MKALRSLFTITGLFIAANIAFAGDYPDMTVEQLHKAIESNSVVVIDVNGSNRYAKGHIPGAIDYSSVKDLSKVLPADKNALVVAYCGGPKCSAFMRAANAAKDLGYKNVKHLSAGISGWEQAGMPTETASTN